MLDIISVFKHSRHLSETLMWNTYESGGRTYLARFRLQAFCSCNPASTGFAPDTHSTLPLPLKADQ